VEYDESPEDCAVREVAEETGLAIVVDGILGVYAGFDDPRQHVALVLYWAKEMESRTPIAGDDADSVGFFAAEALPSNIAFRAHRQALQDLFMHERVKS
jgi:ADP-ribose pyrophosphatase YjhB (NUDIX family)